MFSDEKQIWSEWIWGKGKVGKDWEENREGKLWLGCILSKKNKKTN